MTFYIRSVVRGSIIIMKLQLYTRTTKIYKSTNEKSHCNIKTNVCTKYM